MHLIKLLAYVFIVMMVLLTVIFGLGGGGSEPAGKTFQEACESSAFVAGQTGDGSRKVTVCSCILGWHIRAGQSSAQAGQTMLPLPLYTVDGPAAAAGLPPRIVETDRKAREACTTGRITP